MARQHDKADPRPPEESVEAAIVRRRGLLKKAALLGIPMILTLHGTASAGRRGGRRGGKGSGNTSGNTSKAP